MDGKWHILVIKIFATEKGSNLTDGCHVLIPVKNSTRSKHEPVNAPSRRDESWLLPTQFHPSLSRCQATVQLLGLACLLPQSSNTKLLL